MDFSELIAAADPSVFTESISAWISGISINSVIMMIMMIFMLVGAIDKICGNKLGYGEKFEEGFNAMGPLAMSMAGVVAAAPVLSMLLGPILKPIYGIFGASPAMFATTLLACDMGGYPLAMQLAEMRSRKRKLVDPLQFALSIAAEDLADYSPTFAWEMAPPTQKQLDFLEKRGIYASGVENMGKASVLIDRLMQRQQEGLSTPKQIRLLERYGFRYVGTWSFEAASRIISRLAVLNWKLPHDFNPATYQPN